MEGLPPGAVRYRLLGEGTIVDHDGFTVPLPRPVEALDLNRNFPAGWSPTTTGAGDHPLSEPEIDAVVRAIGARPNICGSHAFHTYGGVLLRPHSWKPDAELPARDLWVWSQLGARATQLTGYPVHSIYEDFTWDRTRPMAGAADDWAYEHLGIYSWTTELWDVIHAATGQRAPTDIWYTGPAPEHELAVARWLDEQHPALAYVDWYPIDHPQLGPVELGGPDVFRVWDNPPLALLAAEVAPHADAVVAHALAAPDLEIRLVDCDAMGERSGAFGTWRVRVGVANTGWLPTEVSARAATERLVLPVTVELDVPEGVAIVGGAHRVELGQLAGRSAFRLNSGARSDGTPDRALATWLVHGAAGSELGIVARHPRAGTARAQVVLG
jgi:hypothetical protein